MNTKELAAHYNVKVFETTGAALEAGFEITETMSPRNVWNKASAAQAIIFKLLARKRSREAQEIGLVIEPWSVTGCYLPAQSEAKTT